MVLLTCKALSNRGIIENGAGRDAERSLTHSLVPKGSILRNLALAALPPASAEQNPALHTPQLPCAI